MGINPMHFAGANADPFFSLNNRCSDLWVQHSWQYADSVSREDLAYSIVDAEQRIANELGWWPAPVWISQELQQYSRHYRRDAHYRYGRNVRSQRISVNTEFAKIISPGRKTIESPAISADAAVVYTDEDGDGFAETATVTAVTSLTNANEIFVFFAGEGGAPEWEIRPPRTKVISAGSVIFTFWSWQMIDPERWERFPNIVTDENLAIDLSGLIDVPPTTTNLVTTVDVYRVYNDVSKVAAELTWEPQSAGTTQLTVQDGTFNIRDAERGLIVPIPATYDDDELVWNQTCFTGCGNPDWVKLWYYAGLYDNRYLAGQTTDPLSQQWALAIAQLAVSKLERPFCSCGNVIALAQKWQLDLAEQGETSHQLNADDLNNPFGTRRGAILAWNTVKRECRRLRGGGAI